ILKKSTMKKILLIISSITFFGTVFAQEAIKGLVKDESGQPLPGATIVLKGSSTYATTDDKGNFTIAASKALPFTLQVNSVGFKVQEVEIYEITDEVAEIILKNDNVLDEIVVVGYGEQK